MKPSTPEALLKAATFDVAAADHRHVWHPYTQHDSAAAPIVVKSASGAYLFDDDGRKIFDAISSWWVTLHGHAQPDVARAIAEQAQVLEQVIFAGFTHEPAARLAAALVERVPAGLTRVFFSDDGSTAVEVATKIALQYWTNRGEPRHTIVALENAYHGDTFGAMSVSGRGLFTDPFARLLFDVERLPDPSASDAVAALESLVAARGREIAAVIVEPLLMGAGGMHMWPASQLRGLREITAHHGIPLIADEVLTGFGRTGPLFACEHAGVSPDIMCLSKGLTAGFMPMGATLATDALFDAFRSPDRMKTLFHGHSFTANPIACAASLASLSLLDARCAEQRRRIEASHHSAADRLRQSPNVSGVRVLGTVIALELRAADRGYLSAVGPTVARRSLERGVLLRSLGDTVYVLPPYCSTDGDLALAYDVIEELAREQ
ncbi:MAG TPA: adenosylmethionine--8-amino-7-oxononanoate transaminase [Gemmatimonadaceae bacterium]|jgi:adenosylmethionine-8-amino-7-oxononanoate aminotransferase|nr:adenosylmethionine--8-amino-7-oxononanoate transaminase [Gemmatimonadaceae bacterium]